jgi:hypothetical protein
MHFSMEPPRLSGSAPSALINGIINGLITWSSFKSSESIALSMDNIGAPGVTALGNAATVAFALALILTCITFFVFRRSAGKSDIAPQALRDLGFWPTGLRIAVLNTLLVFGAFVAMAVLWQYFVGTVHVGPVAATLVVALAAAIATAVTEWRTKREMLAEAGSLR